jgi:hypothetical protein
MVKLVYVNIVGKDHDDQYIYEFYFDDESTIDHFWIIDADIKPASICNLSIPDKQMYTVIKTLKTKFILNVAQKNSCFSFQDCKNGIIPVAWENIDNADEYPEDGRLVFPFGCNLCDIERIISRRDICFEDNMQNIT